eukprot:PITA_28756
MNHIFYSHLRKFVLVFFDDILIYNRTWEEHLQHIETVLRILQEQQFYAKLFKCEFGLMEMLYLGHIIVVDGVRVHEENIRAIREWSEPRNVTELWGFIGICTYYWKFVKSFSQLAATLTYLTRKGAFSWLRFFLEQKQLQEGQQKWISKIQAYDFDIEYVKGKKNAVADALSCRPAMLSLMSLDTNWRARLLVEYSKDRFACEVLDGQVADDRYRVVDEIIYYRDWIFLTEGSQLKKKILRVSHDSPLVGHQGFIKTYRAIRERFSWKGLKEDVLQYI